MSGAFSFASKMEMRWEWHVRESPEEHAEKAKELPVIYIRAGGPHCWDARKRPHLAKALFGEEA